MSSLETTSLGTPSAREKGTFEVKHYLDTALRTVLWVYLASLPFRNLLVIERNGFLVLMVLLLLWSLSHRRLFWRPTPLDIPLLAFVGWVAFTIPFSQLPAYSLKEFGKLLQGVLIFYAVLYFLSNEASRRTLVLFMAGVTLLVSMYGLSQYDPTNQQAMMSFLSSEVWLTTYLVLLIPLCIGFAYGEQRPWLRGLAGTAGAMAIICLVLTKSRAGNLALVVELFALACLLRRWRSAVLGLVIALFIICGLWVFSITKAVLPEASLDVIPMKNDTFSIVHRFDIWKFAVNEIWQHPLVGIGYGKDAFRLVYGGMEEIVEPGHAAVRKAGVHNVVLYHALHVGIPGAILFLWLMIHTMKTLLVGVKESRDDYSYGIVAGILVAVVGAFIRGQFDLMLVGTLAVLFWMLLAVGMIHLPEREQASAGGC